MNYTEGGVEFASSALKLQNIFICYSHMPSHTSVEETHSQLRSIYFNNCMFFHISVDLDSKSGATVKTRGRLYVQYTGTIPGLVRCTFKSNFVYLENKTFEQIAIYFSYIFRRLLTGQRHFSWGRCPLASPLNLPLKSACQSFGGLIVINCLLILYRALGKICS